ncbi:MAG: putative Ig domain-containing protein, partial [Desulfobulbaceae bacterium]|nr:putative Ig domain-containing protein [Desulfobulbaceae bacterium]
FALFPFAALAEPPVADAGENQSVTKNNLLSSDFFLDGTESYDVDGDPFTHEWYGPFGMATGTTPSVIVPQGTYTVSLQGVGCPESSEIDSVEVEVAPAFIITPRTKRGKIQLTWTNIPGTLRYDIYRTTASEPLSFAKIADTTSTYSTYLDYDVVNETSYLYAVAAISDTGDTGYSNIVSSCPPESRSTARLNRQPIIYSPPITQAFSVFPYEYTVLATDPNNDTLTYSLDTYPAGMAIDGATGKISWSPIDIGEVEVTVNVNDGNGLSDSQSYLITVTTLPPTVTLTASPTTIYFGGDGSGGGGEPLSDSGGKGSEEYSVGFVLAQGVDYVKNIAEKFIFAKPAVAAPDEEGEGGGSGYGDQDYSTLSWCATKAEYCIIEPGIGTVEPSGTIDVQPGETTTYTITAYGPGGTATASETVTVIYLPPTVDLTAEPMVVDYRPHYDNTDGYSQWGYDEHIIPVDLNWSSTNATSAEINQSIGSVPAYGWRQVEPEETTTYVITVTGSGGTATDEVTVTVIYPEPPLLFQASPEEIMVGTTTHLVWDTAFADTVTITPDIGTVAKDGSVGVAPEQTTTYTITATGPGGTSMTTTTVHVNYPPPPTEFTGSPQVLNEPGDTATLSWSTSWADSCSIEPGIGSVPVNGSVQVTPTVNTTYTLTVTGPGGITRKSVLISFPAPTVSLGADKQSVYTGNPVTMSWNSTNTDACTIEPDIGPVAASGSTVVTPLQTTTYTISATGPGGTNTSSVTVTVSSPVRITITSPGNGETVTGADIMVTGEISNQTGLETGITVNGILALVEGGRFVANHVAPLPDTNAITVKAVDTAGYTDEKTVIVNPQPTERYITINAGTVSGAAPLETTLRIGTSLLPLESPALTDQGPGTVEYLETNNNSYRIRLTETGIYIFTVQATDEENNTYTDTVAVQVFDRDELDARLQSKWEVMKTAMSEADIEGAVQFFALNNRDVYRQQFTALSAMLPAIVTDMESCTLTDVQENRAVYDLRTVRNGEAYSFQVLFARDRDGIWRIVNF